MENTFKLLTAEQAKEISTKANNPELTVILNSIKEKAEKSSRTYHHYARLSESTIIFLNELGYKIHEFESTHFKIYW